MERPRKNYSVTLVRYVGAVTVISALFAIFQLYTATTSASGLFSFSAKQTLGSIFTGSTESMLVITCPDYTDNQLRDTCVRANGSTSIPLGSSRSFYFEGYVDFGAFFFYDDTYTVTTFDTSRAKVSTTSENGPWSNSINISVQRDVNGYVRSPTIWVRGTALGTNLLWA